MNEASKLMVAAALVALGLGLAYLCGPPADSPQVIRNLGDWSVARQLTPLGSAAVALPLRLHADALPAAEVLADAAPYDRRSYASGGPPATDGVVLSAAETDVRQDPPESEEPSWHPPVTDRDGHELAPPRRIEMHDDAEPLSAIAPLSARCEAAGNDWLLKPPVIPRSFNGEADSGIVASARVEERTHERISNETSAWWTHDTPRLQGLNASAPPIPLAAPRSEAESRLVPVPAPLNVVVVAPIEPNRDLDKSSAGHLPSDASTPPVDVAVPMPTRTHLIVDGDTLGRLAERYLGDAGRAEEILTLNREALGNPDLLPIGMPLRIPAAAGQAEPEADPIANVSENRLVPVAAMPSAAAPQPHARLQGPAPIAANGR